MSQVRAVGKMGGRNVGVVGGWDYPLNGYHFTVYSDDPEEENPLYCNLDDRGLSGICWPLSNDHFRRVVDKMNIQLPEGFWERADKMERNVFYSFDDGKWERRE